MAEKILANEIAQKEHRIAVLRKKMKLEERNLAEMKQEFQRLKATSEASTTSAVAETKKAEVSQNQQTQQSKSWADQAEEEDRRLQKILFEEKTQMPDVSDKQADRVYVVFDGPQKGIYTNWGVVNTIVSGKNYGYKAYNSQKEANDAFGESFKTVLLAPDYRISRGKTPLFPPKDYRIMTIAEKIAAKQLSFTSFRGMINRITGSTELSVMMKFYPVHTRIGTKAITLPGAEPDLVWDFMQGGLLSEIYLSPNLKELGKFPKMFIKSVRAYQQRIAREKSMVLKVTASLPRFSTDGRLIFSSYAVVTIATHNEKFPPKAEQFREPEDTDFFKSVEMVIKRCTKITIEDEGKSNVFLNYKGGKMLLLSMTNRSLRPEGLKEILAFEDQMSNSPEVQGLSAEDQKGLCFLFLEATRLHRCQLCEESYKEAYKEAYPALLNDESSDEGLDIIVE